MIILDIEQNTPDWIELRRSKIGASDVPTLMLGSESDKYALYLRKITGEELHVTEAMQRGHDLEPEARTYFEMVSGRSFLKVTGIHEEHPFLMSSFDGYDGQSPLEIKCPGTVPDVAEEAKDFEKYWWQVQTQLCVCDAERGTLLLYHPLKQRDCVIVRDDEAIGKIVEAARVFNEYLSGAKEYPTPWEDRLDAEWFEASESLREATKNREAWEAQEKMSRETLIYLAGEKSSRGNGVSLTRIVRKGAVEYAKIPQLKGLDLEVYRKAPIVSWRANIA